MRKATKLQAVDPSQDCLVCGARMVVYTEAEQQAPPGEGWSAYDGDTAKCPECGFRGWVSVADEEAWINWDETSPHNLRVAKRWERKQARKSSEMGGSKQ